MKKTFVINGQEVVAENAIVGNNEVSLTIDGNDYHFTTSRDANGGITLHGKGENRRGTPANFP